MAQKPSLHNYLTAMNATSFLGINCRDKESGEKYFAVLIYGESGDQIGRLYLSPTAATKIGTHEDLISLYWDLVVWVNPISGIGYIELPPAPTTLAAMMASKPE